MLSMNQPRLRRQGSGGAPGTEGALPAVKLPPSSSHILKKTSPLTKGTSSSKFTLNYFFIIVRARRWRAGCAGGRRLSSAEPRICPGPGRRWTAGARTAAAASRGSLNLSAAAAASWTPAAFGKRLCCSLPEERAPFGVHLAPVATLLRALRGEARSKVAIFHLSD